MIERLKSLWLIAQITAATLVLTFICHLISQPETPAKLWPGHVLLFTIVMIGFIVAKLIPTKLPDLFWVSIAATLAGMPFIPGSSWFIGHVSQMSMVPTITPVLALAALGLQAEDITRFRQIGLQVIAVSLLVFAGTFFGSALVAQVVLHFSG
ncbi:MAG: hypothetical protein AAF221_01835 [Pseudomonadota bacterium]